MVLRFCSACNRECPIFELDGEQCCTECGTVISVSRTVDEIEFSETGGGGKQVVGTIVGSYGTAKYGYNRPSSEITLNKARQNIEECVFNLKIPSQIVDQATRLYKLLLASNFTRGRKTHNVIAATVYASCRMNEPRPLPYMLIDFADFFSVNIFELGHTFLRMSEKLSLRLPLVDPSIFVPRFAERLALGGKESHISKCAIRLVARMKRDWIVTGRRPAGICGAALLIATRLFGFIRSVKEVSLIVHLSVTTLQKRLSEFKETSTCNLTPVEFDTILDFDDIEASDPPAFTNSRKRAEQLRNQPVLTAEEIAESIKQTLGILEDEQIKAIAEHPKAPPNIHRDRPVAEGEEPPAKKAKTIEEMDEEDVFDPLDPSQYIYEEPSQIEDNEKEREVVEESLSDLDDEEIELLIANEQEVVMNTMIWNNMYSEWEAERQEKEDAARAQGLHRTPRPRKSEPQVAESPVEAVTTALSRRLVSSKINMNAIEKLLEGTAEHAKPTNRLLDFVKVSPSVQRNNDNSDSD